MGYECCLIQVFDFAFIAFLYVESSTDEYNSCKLVGMRSDEI